MARIEFTDNYEDLSTDLGYQFKFFCESCGNGYMSSWQASTSGMASSVVRAAGNIFGGLFGRAASGAWEVQQAVGGPEHDRALESAVKRDPATVSAVQALQAMGLSTDLLEQAKALCKSCAPICSASWPAQAEIAVEQAREAPPARPHRGRGRRRRAVVLCPSCGAEIAREVLLRVRRKLAPKTECPRCGSKVAADDKFCPDAARLEP